VANPAELDQPQLIGLDSVTEREREVIRSEEQGLSNKEIADRLCISDSTVRSHLTNMFNKVGVRSRQKLLIHAHQFRASHPLISSRSVRVSVPPQTRKATSERM